jgi:uncharacterized protein YqgC (DUF456 family)
VKSGYWIFFNPICLLWHNQCKILGKGIFKQRENVMKTVYATILSILITGTHALASGNGVNHEGLSLLATFFIAFGILVIIFQLVPGLLLFGGMIKGLFSPADKKSHEFLAGSIDKNS